MLARRGRRGSSCQLHAGTLTVSGTNVTALTLHRFLPSPTLSSRVHGTLSDAHKYGAIICGRRATKKVVGRQATILRAGGTRNRPHGAARPQPRARGAARAGTHVARRRRVRRQVQRVTRRRRGARAAAEAAQPRLEPGHQQRGRLHRLAPLRRVRVLRPERRRRVAGAANHGGGETGGAGGGCCCDRGGGGAAAAAAAAAAKGAARAAGLQKSGQQQRRTARLNSGEHRER